MAPDAIVNLSDERAENLHEVINGVSWFGVSRVYRVIPQTGGAFEIPSFPVTVHPGGTSAPAASLVMPTLRLVATSPAGAEGMSVFFPTQKLGVKQTIEPSPDDLKVVGALTRIITQTAAGTESMLIPPVILATWTGLNATRNQPVRRTLSRTGQGRLRADAGTRRHTSSIATEDSNFRQ